MLLDTHAVHWWSAEPHRLSDNATAAVESADELAVSAVTWYELAWLAHHGRIEVTGTIRAWLDAIALHVRTATVTPAIAGGAASLPATFPGDPADRMIYATAVEHGWRLVTKDGRLRRHRHPARPTLW